jgi:hypothetical protein
MIKYKVIDEENRPLFDSLDSYQLVYKNDILFGDNESDIGKIKSNWATLGMFISNIVVK